jgi:hypothetical protein
MPDFVSRKRLKKKVIDRWENEGGMSPADRTKAAAAHPPPKRKRKKMRLEFSQDSPRDRA